MKLTDDNTNWHLSLTIHQLAFSLHSASVSCPGNIYLSLSNCDTALTANSVDLKYLISWCDCVHIHAISDRGTFGCVL